MAYPIDGYPDSGNCPDTHPVRLVTLFYEQVFDVGSFPYNGPGTCMCTTSRYGYVIDLFMLGVLANGDDTGYGFHGVSCPIYASAKSGGI